MNYDIGPARYDEAWYVEAVSDPYFMARILEGIDGCENRIARIKADLEHSDSPRLKADLESVQTLLETLRTKLYEAERVNEVYEGHAILVVESNSGYEMITPTTIQNAVVNLEYLNGHPDSYRFDAYTRTDLEARFIAKYVYAHTDLNEALDAARQWVVFGRLPA